MLAEFEKGLLTQQIRDETWRGGSLLLFAVIALFALGWVMDVADLRREEIMDTVLGLALIGFGSEIGAAMRSRSAVKIVDRDFYEQLARSNPKAFGKVLERLKKPN